jgi:hypothetical protein
MGAGAVEKRVAVGVAEELAAALVCGEDQPFAQQLAASPQPEPATASASMAPGTYSALPHGLRPSRAQ